MKVLLVGAGAVGVTYGFHLARGGADVTYLVKPKHADGLRSGLDFHRLNRRRPVERFTEFELLTDASDAVGGGWDQVWLCVSSTALHAGDWLPRLLAGIGEATLVTLQPGLEDRAQLEALYPAERIVSGMISLIAYQTPLPGGSLTPGIACWFPPLGPSPFSGDRVAVERIVSTLRRGGCPAKRARDVAAQLAFGSALMMPVIAGLEAAGWSFASLPRHEVWRGCRRAAHQTSVVARPGFRRWLVGLVMAGPLLRGGLWLAPRVIPLDLQTYLQYHFTKVGDQTRAALRLYATRAEERGLPHDAVDDLCERLG